jgi:uncharacterized OB-fold protein
LTPPLGIRPEPGPVGEPYWDGAREHELRLQRCRPNGHLWHPPAERCPACHAEDYDWIAASGRGVVHSWTTVHHAVHPAVADRVPYTVLLVDLDEGPRIVSLYRGGGDPEVGAPVEVRFEDYDEVTLPVFVPAGGEA